MPFERDQSDDADDEKAGDMPVLSNDQHGAAAWLNTDKNGNAYFSVKLPLGMGSLNLFPTGPEMEDALNQLKEYVDG